MANPYGAVCLTTLATPRGSPRACVLNTPHAVPSCDMDIAGRASEHNQLIGATIRRNIGSCTSSRALLAQAAAGGPTRDASIHGVATDSATM